MFSQLLDVDCQQSQLLVNVVVELSSDTGAFLLLYRNQFAGHGSKSLLRLLALGHIHIYSDHSQGFTGFIHNHLSPPSYPMDTPVGPYHPILPLRRLSRFQGKLTQLDDTFPVIRMNQILESLFCLPKTAWRQTVQCLHFRRQSNLFRPKIPFKSSNASSPLCRSQALLASTQRLFCVFLISNVHTH